MGWKRVVGKLLLIGAGGGCLVVLVFVGLPWLTEMLQPQEPQSPEEIVAEVLNVPAVNEDDAGLQDAGEEEGVARAPSPLVAIRNNGEEIAIVFPDAGGEETQDETAVVDDTPADEEEGAGQGSTVEVLPPVLSPEEVAAAMAGLESVAEGDDGRRVSGAQGLLEPGGEDDQRDPEGGLPGEILESSTEPGSERKGAALQEGWQGEGVLAMDSDGARHIELTLPPPSATRDVQELLEALGYGPGPLDGIWGERTEGAWRRFARDAGQLAARSELAQLLDEALARDADQPAARTEFAPSRVEAVVEPSVAEIPTPSGETVEAEDDGAGQTVGTRHSTGLPPQPVVVPGILRGVMGYRMPLVSRQGVPDQVVSGVLIPAHTTFVILKPGYWELVGLEPGEVERLRDASSRRESAAEVSGRDGKPVKRGWNPLRLFRRQGPSGSAK